MDRPTLTDPDAEFVHGDDLHPEIITAVVLALRGRGGEVNARISYRVPLVLDDVPTLLAGLADRLMLIAPAADMTPNAHRFRRDVLAAVGAAIKWNLSIPTPTPERPGDGHTAGDPGRIWPPPDPTDRRPTHPKPERLNP